MKVGLQTWGTRGDVEPFFALARGLLAAGHEVELLVSTQADAALPDLQGGTVQRVGQAMTQEQGDALFDRIIALGSPMAQARVVLEEGLLPGADAMYEAATDLARSCDVLVRHHFLYMTQAAALVAEVPEVSVYLTPDLLPTTHVAPTGMPNLGPLNGLAWRMADKGITGIFGRSANELRARASLPRARGVLRDVWPSSTANLIAVSPTLCPAPPDLPATNHLSGFWQAPTSADAPLDESLRAFLEAGPPPIFAGFGSMGAGRGARRDSDLALLVEASQRAERRMILQVAEGEAVDVPDSVHVVHRAPHAALFPRCDVVIHHGGAGTTQTAVQAGVPSVIVPHLADQFFWGAQVRRVGAGEVTKARAKVTARQLAHSIVAASEATDRGALRALGQRMREERGVPSAIRVIESAARSGQGARNAGET